MRGRKMSEIPDRLPGNHVVWDAIVNGIAESKNELERSHIFAGWMDGSVYPMLLSPAHYRNHVAFIGATNNGKTSLGMLPLVVQLIRRKGNSVFWFDLKGDLC